MLALKIGLGHFTCKDRCAGLRLKIVHFTQSLLLGNSIFTSEVGYSRNLTARANIQVTKYATRAKQPNLLTKRFTRKSISRQVCTFNPVNCKQKLAGEMMEN